MKIEMVPMAECVMVALTDPDGEVRFDEMTWEEFQRLQRKLDQEEDHGPA